jgi:hypothetical protein
LVFSAFFVYFLFEDFLGGLISASVPVSSIFFFRERKISSRDFFRRLLIICFRAVSGLFQEISPFFSRGSAAAAGKQSREATTAVKAKVRIR